MYTNGTDKKSRPTLLVIAADHDYEAKSLAEVVSRIYSGTMQRLTEKFSQKHWDIPVLDMMDTTVADAAVAGLEHGNMAILTGYKGTAGEQAALQRIKQFSNPVVTLIDLGQRKWAGTADFKVFDKAVTLLPQAVADQFVLTNQILKETRQENTYGPWLGRPGAGDGPLSHAAGAG